MVTHIPTTIINAPSILPIIFDFWYPKKVVVSGVVKGSKKTTIPINTIELQLRLFGGDSDRSGLSELVISWVTLDVLFA